MNNKTPVINDRSFISCSTFRERLIRFPPRPGNFAGKGEITSGAASRAE